MKRNFTLLVMLVFVFMLTGCGEVSKKKSLEIIDAAINEELISSNYKLDDIVTRLYDTKLFGVYKDRTYIYKNNYSKLIAIEIYRIKEDSKKYYIISIYNNVTINDFDIEYIYDKDENGDVPWQYLKEGYYTYKEGYPSVKNKYNIDMNADVIRYNVYENRGLFGNIKYKFEK